MQQNQGIRKSQEKSGKENLFGKERRSSLEEEHKEMLKRLRYEKPMLKVREESYEGDMWCD